jgi:hypothetical protein
VNDKGFVITVDAFLGATLILLFIIISYFYLSQVALTSWNLVDLRNIVNDEAAVLEKTMALEYSVNQSSSDVLLSKLNESSMNICFEVTIINPSTALPVIHAMKTGCVKNASEVVSIERSFVVNEDDRVSFFIARVEGWIK